MSVAEFQDVDGPVVHSEGGGWASSMVTCASGDLVRIGDACILLCGIQTSGYLSLLLGLVESSG